MEGDLAAAARRVTGYLVPPSAPAAATEAQPRPPKGKKKKKH